MNRSFIADYFDKVYDEPVSAAVEDDEEYRKLNEEFFQKEQEFEKMLGGPDSKEYLFFDELMTKSDEMWERVMKGAYLMGARDRERMLH
ncbi:MAG: hypothetical protein LIP10_13170 [Clostridiales bacterium]|nr:hypothetical protein [Clostridiales bacterium]